MQKNSNIFLTHWLSVIIYAAFVFLLSSMPCALRTPPIYSFDKILHIFEYAAFGILYSRAFLKSFPKATILKYYIWVVSALAFYGVSDELHQLLVPNREFSFYDILADAVGAGFGAFLYRLGLSKNYGRYKTIQSDCL